MHDLTLNQLFESSLRLNASKPAVTIGAQRYTYAELARRSLNLASGLRRRGVTRGDRIALLMRNQIEFVISDLAIARMGCVKVPLNIMLSPGDIEYMLEHSGARVVIFDDQMRHVLEPALDRTPRPIRVHVGADGAAPYPCAEDLNSILRIDAAPDELRTLRVSGNDPAAIFYTGGTTGRPKGVLHTQSSLAMNQLAQLTEAEITSDERLLLATPLPHAAGLFLQTALIRGAGVHVLESFDADKVLDEIEANSITWTFLVPTMLYRMLDALNARPRDVSSLRTIVYGAAPIAPTRLEQALSAFGPVFVQLYGQTECPNWGTRLSKADHSPREGRREILASCGKPSLLAQVRIGDDEGNELPSGEIGEIYLKSPYLLREYWRDEAATDSKFVNDWIRTGDIGLQDADGYVYLKDRVDDMIISGGMNVYTTEVEEVLVTCPGVRGAAVIAIPDDDWGEAVHAVIVADPGVTPEDVIKYCDANLARYKRPKSVSIVGELPVTPYGKTDKKCLREPFWAGYTRSIN